MRNQLLKSARSTTANFAEGYGRCPIAILPLDTRDVNLTENLIVDEALVILRQLIDYIRRIQQSDYFAGSFLNRAGMRKLPPFLASMIL